MSPSQYNPEIHHQSSPHEVRSAQRDGSEAATLRPAGRRSIRLKGHDYAGGGLYFVTICAHRDAGNIFAPEEVKEMVAREWESAMAAVAAGLVSAQSARPQEEGGHKTRPYAIMPDHFHALIEMPAGEKSLGDAICAFKSRVVHEYIGGVNAGKWPRFPGKIWHRNYYEMIVRTPEAEQNIAQYIRMNPWRCVMDFGNGLRGLGNPALWSAEKLGVLASRGGMEKAADMRPALTGNVVALGGFHSPMEKEIFARLLEEKRPVIWCPAWGVETTRLPPAALEALEQNRLLILELRKGDTHVALAGDLAAAEQRNRFVLEQADQLWLPHVTPGGMLDRLVREMQVQGKKI